MCSERLTAALPKALGPIQASSCPPPVFTRTLQARLKEGVARETALSQAAIDAKPRELLGGLGMAAWGSSAAGTAPAAATFGWPPAAAAAVKAGASPAPRRPRSAVSCSAAPSCGMAPPAPPPAVAAANEAIAALRAQLPPSPAKLRAGGSSPARPAIKLTATSGSAAEGIAAAVPDPRAARAVQLPLQAASGAGMPITVAPPGAAPRQPAAKPAGLSVRFVAEPASSAAPQAAAARQRSSRDGSGGQERGGLMAHTSSSEFDGEPGSLQLNSSWMGGATVLSVRLHQFE